MLSVQKYKLYYLCAEIQPVLSLCRNTACAILVRKYKLCCLCAGIQTVLSVCRNPDCVICVQEYRLCCHCAGIQTVLSLCRNTDCAVSVQEYRLCYLCAGIQAAESHGLLVFHAGTAQKDGKIVTSGGRVLAVVAVDTDLQAASERAQKGAADVRFEGSFYRSDIGHCALKR